MTIGGGFLIMFTMIGALAVAVVGRVLGEDAKSFIPRFSLRLIRVAANRITEEHSVDYFEEWLAHLDETPELTGKLWHAVSIYLWGGRSICNTLGTSSACRTRYDRYKRFFDLFLVAQTIPVISAILILMSILLFVRYRAFPFCSVGRVGANGKTFNMWKLRTMPANADQILLRHLVSNNAARYEWHTTGRLKQDPRLTGLGLFLKKASLDELPQLWNVLIGDMSIVGPMPLTVSQDLAFPKSHSEQIRPGITGFWQVQYPHIKSFKDVARIDADYAQRRSFKTDMKVIFETALSVFRNPQARP